MNRYRIVILSMVVALIGLALVSARSYAVAPPVVINEVLAGNGSYHGFRAVSAATEFKRGPPSGLGHHDGRGLAWGTEAWQRFNRHGSP